MRTNDSEHMHTGSNNHRVVLFGLSFSRFQIKKYQADNDDVLRIHGNQIFHLSVHTEDLNVEASHRSRSDCIQHISPANTKVELSPAFKSASGCDHDRENV